MLTPLTAVKRTNSKYVTWAIFRQLSELYDDDLMVTNIDPTRIFFDDYRANDTYFLEEDCGDLKKEKIDEMMHDVIVMIEGPSCLGEPSVELKKFYARIKEGYYKTPADVVAVFARSEGTFYH